MPEKNTMNEPSEWDGHPDDAAKPCSHMPSLLSALADGKLKGLARWYAEQHTARCEHCRPVLASLMVLQARVHIYGVEPADEEAVNDKLRLDPAKRAAAEAAWARIDRET